MFPQLLFSLRNGKKANDKKIFFANYFVYHLILYTFAPAIW